MAGADTSIPESRDRGGERRGNERRRLDRRTPPPPWRRPWAFAAYGAVAALVVLLAVTGWPATGRRRDPPIVERPAATQPPRAAPNVAPAAPEAAYGAAGFERLTLEGAAAVGRHVRTELYCEQPASFRVREGVPPEAAVAALAANGRVPAAECKWGSANDPRREDFVLLVPPDLADRFASTPVVTDQFQRRRRISAEVEWLGRSEALALRPAGVFRGLAR
jgi:hypothetical protein